MAVFEYIESWYNPNRRHSSIGYLPPVHYEKRFKDSREIPSPNLST